MVASARGRLLILLLGLLGAGCGESGREASPASSGGGLRLSSVLGEDAIAGFARAEPGYRFQFPLDHGTHPEFRSEWWYLTLMLEDDQGQPFGGQFTLFRQALRPRADAAPTEPPGWSTEQLYMAHLAVSDVARRRHRSAERLSRGHERLAGVTLAPFRAYIEDWSLRATEAAVYAPADAAGLLPLELVAGTDDFRWDLTLSPGRPLVLQGEQGFSAKGPGQASFYYSYSRLAVAGTLTLDDDTYPVSGSGWLDREWSTSVLGAEQIGWDWFALQLDDGRDFMAFRLRRRDCQRDPFDHGLAVSATGRAERLGSERFELTPDRWWVPADAPAASGQACPGEQAGYPVRWQLVIDGEAFTVEAAFDDQRMQTTVRYWEGLVWVSQAGKRIGRGYLEMTGY